MIRQDEADTQVSRLNWLPKFPRSESVTHFEELSKALQSAPDLATAVIVIDEFCQEATECPLPADIHRMLRYHVERRAQEQELRDSERQVAKWLNPTCQTCGDTGFVIREVNGVEGAEPCACRRAT